MRATSRRSTGCSRTRCTLDRLETWYNENVSPEWSNLVQQTMGLLQQENELEEIVRLVGIDALSYKDRMTLEATRSIREDYLHQNAFHEVDTYTSPKKQYLMLKAILLNYEKSLDALAADASFNKLIQLPVREAHRPPQVCGGRGAGRIRFHSCRYECTDRRLDGGRAAGCVKNTGPLKKSSAL